MRIVYLLSFISLTWARSPRVIFGNDDGLGSLHLHQLYKTLNLTEGTYFVSAPCDDKSGTGKHSDEFLATYLLYDVDSHVQTHGTLPTQKVTSVLLPKANADSTSPTEPLANDTATAFEKTAWKIHACTG